MTDLSGMSIAVLSGYHFYEDLKVQPPFEVIEVDTQEQLFAMVSRNRVDAALVMHSQYTQYRHGHYPNFKIYRRPLINFWVYLGFSKLNFDEEFAIKFGKQMELYWDTSEYTHLQIKYGNMQKKP